MQVDTVLDVMSRVKMKSYYRTAVVTVRAQTKSLERHGRDCKFLNQDLFFVVTVYYSVKIALIYNIIG